MNRTPTGLLNLIAGVFAVIALYGFISGQQWAIHTLVIALAIVVVPRMSRS